MKRLLMRPPLLWLQGYKPSANVAGTGSVPYGRKEGAYGQQESVSLCERRKRGHWSSLGRSSAGKPGLAATEGMAAWRSGGSSRRRGRPCTWRSTAVIATSYGGESRGLRRMSASIKTQRNLATQAMHQPAHRFDHLYWLLCQREWIATALRGVLTNTGARTPGIDGLTKSHLSLRGGKIHLLSRKLNRSCASGASVHHRCDGFISPRAMAHNARLGISTLKDRVVQMLL